MQPQDAGGNGFDWMHAASALGGAVFGALSAIGTWVYKAGAREPTIRSDFQEKLTSTERDMEAKIEDVEKRIEVKVEGLVSQFHESFAALRQKMNDVERDSVGKQDFNDFRKEHREDMQQFRKENREDFTDLKRNVAKILGERT